MMRGRDNRWSRGNRDGNRRGGFNRGGFGRGGFRGGLRRGFSGSRDGGRYPSNNQWHNKPKTDSPGQRLSEDQIGVTQYMGDHEGFNGIIKSRYSDFQVSEINLQGEVGQLTILTPPEQPAEEQVEEDEELLLTKYNVEILPMDMWDQINKVAVGTAAEPVEIDVTKSTKEERTKIHEAVKKAFGESIVGSTVNTDDKKFVRFEKYKKGVRIDNRVKWTWPAEYVHFLVHKENCDTMDAAVKIAERLRNHIKPSMVGYAGTKDRRAKTTQWFCLRKIDPRKISNACRDLRDLRVGNYSFHHHHLKLGMLKGNRFRIALRNVTAADSVVEAACSRLREHGFINYYGLQRFGTRVEVPTYHVGMKLLKGNFQEAIDSILSAREGPLRAALAEYARGGAGGAGAALAALPRFAHSSLEARLLQALHEKPNDLYYALQRIPRNTRLLYLHAYQSLVWNRCVSERIRKHGLAPAVGDLVPAQPGAVTEDPEDEESDSEESPENPEKPTETPENSTETPENSTETPENSTETPENASETPENASETPKNLTEKTESLDKKPQKKKQEKVKVPVKVLTQEDVDSGSYTIFDIIMPLPGYFVEYPPNMRDYYETLLTNDGLKLDLRHKNKSYCMSGAYRHVAVRPEDVSWESVRYSDPYADLVLSDLDLLAGTTSTGRVPDGEFKAVVVSLSLPPSCYATMALRELLRADTSCHSQALQNNYHKRSAGPRGQGEGAAPGGKRPREGE